MDCPPGQKLVAVVERCMAASGCSIVYIKNCKGVIKREKIPSHLISTR